MVKDAILLLLSCKTQSLYHRGTSPLHTVSHWLPNPRCIQAVNQKVLFLSYVIQNKAQIWYQPY
jgi:hypothetical protein